MTNLQKYKAAQKAPEKVTPAAVPAKLKSAATQSVLDELRKAVESVQGEWGTVYLDNALFQLKKLGIEGKVFSGHCSVLKQLGLYKESTDKDDKGIFGYVRMAP